MSLSLTLADAAGLRWAQMQVTRFHYLHTPVDARCLPVAYLVLLDGGQQDPCCQRLRPLRQARCYDQLPLLPASAGSSVHDKEAQSYAR